MHDDDAMGLLLREALAAPLPRLSPSFDNRLRRRLRPRHLTASGRAVMAVYALVAVATAGWLMRGLPPATLAAAAAIGVAAAAATSVYARRLAFGE